MSDNRTKLGNKNEHRGNQRYEYSHHLDVTFMDKQLPARIIDWSTQGIQVLVNAPIDNQTKYETEFDIHRMSFIADEEYEDDDFIPPVEEWSLTGTIRWMRKLKTGVAIGINFEESLDGLPLSELPDFITDGDLCQLRIFLSEKNSN